MRSQPTMISNNYNSMELDCFERGFKDYFQGQLNPFDPLLQMDKFYNWLKGARYAKDQQESIN